MPWTSFLICFESSLPNFWYLMQCECLENSSACRIVTQRASIHVYTGFSLKFMICGCVEPWMQTSRVQVCEHSHCSLLLTEYWTFLYLLKKRVRSQKIGYLKTHVSWVHFSEMFYSLKLSLFFLIQKEAQAYGHMRCLLYSPSSNDSSSLMRVVNPVSFASINHWDIEFMICFLMCMQIVLFLNV